MLCLCWGIHGQAVLCYHKREMDPNYNQYPAPQQPFMASDVKKSHSTALFVALAIFTVLTLVFGVLWITTASKYSDLNNNFNEKLAVATDEAAEEISAKKDAELAEKEKSPFKVYQGPAAFGSIKITYPKTWAAYVTEEGKGSQPINGYFHPGYVPGMQSGTAFALRLEVMESDYAQLLRRFESDSKSGKVTVTPYQVGDTAGVRVDGELENKKKGSAVLFPLRDKTVRLTSESEQFVKDFDEIILKHFTFSP